MAGDIERPEHGTNPTVDSLAALIAMGANGDTAAEAREYLKKQSHLADLQIVNLQKLDDYETSHLRWRRFNDQMGGALQMLLVVIGVLIVATIAVTAWSASRENGLVIEAFSVPPDLAARGLSGQVVAAQLEDKLAAMQNATKSARPAASYSNNWGNDIKVQIPETGVSFGEAYRYLASLFGHETRISGEVYRQADVIAVTARAGGDGGSTVAGPEPTLDTLLQQVAEKIYQHTQPYRYAMYLEQLGPKRLGEARTVLEGLAANGSPRERAWAYVGIGNLDLRDNSSEQGMADIHKAIALMPNFALAYINLDLNEAGLGHDEASLAAARQAVQLLQSGTDIEMSEASQAASLQVEQSNLAFAQNDFIAALAFSEKQSQLPDYSDSVENARQSIIITLGLLHDGEAARRAIRELPTPQSDSDRGGRTGAKLLMDYWLGDWSSVVTEHKTAEAIILKAFTSIGLTPAFTLRLFSRQVWPYVAVALARTGDFAGAHALIEKTPGDCYTCILHRAVIYGLERNWLLATRWFALAVREAPSIAMGYSDWGAMLLHKGDYDAAIAKFTLANQRGPHFADPLEMWGEALMLKNRSDLALAKFEDANKYAPNWGRLHMKWGEALGYVGRKDDARAQYSIASTLDLSVADKVELARDMQGRG